MREGGSKGIESRREGGRGREGEGEGGREGGESSREGGRGREGEKKRGKGWKVERKNIY